MESHTNNAVNVAQATLEELGSQFVRVCVDHERGPLPMEADQLSYACLLLCDEHADALGTNAPNVIANCLKAARAASLWEWIDILPWQCCLERLGVEKYGNATNQLIGNLDHRRSDIRLFLFEIA
ncbi:MAG: hypothetical protein U9Q79_08565, partial [Candidatus Hydrogenedentes bacterium]|nr:hypothetical protein [Candidatus Hydrogenedentota bacterium]